MLQHHRTNFTSMSSALTSNQKALLAVFSGVVAAMLGGCGNSIHALGGPASTPVTTPSPSAVQSGPQLGYIWSDKTHTLRPVLGIPGSTQLGQSVVAENVYVAGAASSLSNLALLQESDGALDLMSLPAGTPAQLAVTLAPGALLRFAPSGLAAIAFVPGASAVTLFTGLPATPKSATVTFGAAIADAVVSDAGSVAAAVAQPGGSAIRTIAANGTANLAGAVGTLGGMTFVGVGEDLLVADAGANSLTVVHHSTSAPLAVTLASGGLLNGPTGVGASHDGHWAVLANGGDTSVVRVDLTALTAPQRFSCFCQPALVAPLAGAGVFRLTTADSGPAWMLDASASTPRLLFIPAAADASVGQKAGLN